jgi:hypothetical protein
VRISDIPAMAPAAKLAAKGRAVDYKRIKIY